MRVACRRVLIPLLAHLALLALVAEVARAQAVATDAPKKPVSTLEKTVVEIIDIGANMFNSGDPVACQRFYEGAIFGLRPVLETMPETRKKVDVFIRESILAKTVPDRAFALRKALDEILTASRAMPASAREPGAGAMANQPAPAAAPSTAPVPVPAAEPPPKPLWDRIGGLESIKPIVTQWVSLILDDKKLDFTRGGKYPIDKVARSNLELLLVQYISEATGGTEKYTGRSMQDSHKGMQITDAEFNLMMGHLIEVLRAQLVPRLESSQLVTALNSSRKEIVEIKTTESAPAAPPAGLVAPPSTKPLWDRLGGEPGVSAIVHELLELSLKNNNIDFTRGGKYKLDAATRARVEKRFVEFISVHGGGPLKYSGKTMKAAHAGMGITESQFDSMGGDLISVMRARKLSQELIDELVTVLGASANEIIEAK